jgi:hypothetical protein
VGPVTAYQTFAVAAPLGTHWRPATCAEVDCPNYLGGWRVRVELLTPELLHAARTSGRRYTEQRVAEGETWLIYEPGQPCFQAAQHRLRTGQPELYVVRDGDFRGNPTGRVRQHTRPEDWVDQFGEHQQRITDEIKKG